MTRNACNTKVVSFLSPQSLLRLTLCFSKKASVWLGQQLHNNHMKDQSSQGYNGTSLKVSMTNLLEQSEVLQIEDIFLLKILR